MTGTYGNVPDYLIPFDRDGSRMRRYSPDASQWERLDNATLQALADIADTTVPITGSGADTGSYVVRFPSPRRLTGVFASFTQGASATPVQRVNYCRNPSLKRGIQGFTVAGTGLAIAANSGINPDSYATFKATGTPIGGDIVQMNSATDYAYRVPVVAGNRTVISCYVRLRNTATTFTMRLDTSYQATPTTGSTSTAAGAVISVKPNTWVRLYCISIVPAGQVTCIARFNTQSAALPANVTVDFTGWLAETGPTASVPALAGSYFDGDTTHALWTGAQHDSWSTTNSNQQADRVNLIPTPRFDTPAKAGDWVGYSGSLSLPAEPLAPWGTKVARVTVATAAAGTQAYLNPDGGRLPAVLPSTAYTYSVWVRASVAISASVAWFPVAADGQTLLAGTVGTPVALAANTWTRVSMTATTPADAAFLRPNVNTTTALAVGATIDFAGALLEVGSTLSPYFDGNTSTARWAGSPGLSASTLPSWVDIEWVSVAMDVSMDTTDGVDGTWVEIIAPDQVFNGAVAGVFGSPTVPGFRNAIIGGLNIPSVSAVRFRMATRSGIGTWTWRTLHLYGDRSSVAGLSEDYLLFWHPTADYEVFPEYFDFGDVDATSSKDVLLRVKNASQTQTAKDVVVLVEDLATSVGAVTTTGYPVNDGFDGDSTSTSPDAQLWGTTLSLGATAVRADSALGLTPAPQGAAMVIAGIYTLAPPKTDLVLATTLSISDITASVIRLRLRNSSPADLQVTSSLCFEAAIGVDTGVVNLWAYTSGGSVANPLGSAAIPGWAKNTDHSFELWAVGNDLSLFWWSMGDCPQDPLLKATSTLVPAAGVASISLSGKGPAAVPTLSLRHVQVSSPGFVNSTFPTGDNVLLSSDGRSFYPRVNIPTLPPGGLTNAITLRKVAPKGAPAGLRHGRILAVTNRWT